MAGTAHDARLVVLQSATHQLRKQLNSADASPFLGHHALEAALTDRVALAIKTIVQGDQERFVNLFRTFPLVSAWFTVSSLATHYGHEGHLEIYGPVARAIGANTIDPSIREALSKCFRAACFKYALPLPPPGQHDRTEDYIVQAGAAHAQLPELARAFIRAERDHGPPPLDDTAQLSVWSLQAISFAHVGMTRLRRVIQYDTAGYHAAAFERVRRAQVANTPFESKLLEAVKRASEDIKPSSSVVVAPPNLSFLGGELALELPRGANAVMLGLQARERLLLPGERLALPDPWPEHVFWSVGDGTPASMPVVGSSEGLAFDASDGRLLRRFPLTNGETSVDATAVNIISRTRFQVDGDESTTIGRDAEAHYLELSSKATVTTKHGTVILVPSGRPRLLFHEVPIAVASSAALIACPDRVGVTAHADTLKEELEVLAEHPALSVPLRVPVRFNGSEWCADLKDLPRSGVFGRLRLSLVQRQQLRPLARTSAWLWPGLRELVEGMVFDALAVPGNLDIQGCRNVTIVDGKLGLDVRSNYASAQICFRDKDGSPVIFDVPRPGLGLSIVARDKTERALALGSEVVISGELDSTLVIRSSDRAAELDVLGRKERSPFLAGPERRLSLASLLTNSGHQEVRYAPYGDWNLAYTIATVVSGTVPQAITIEGQSNRKKITWRFRQKLSAIQVIGHNLVSGAREEITCRLEDPPNDIFVTRFSRSQDGRVGSVELDPRRLGAGVWRIEFRAQFEGEARWGPLINERADEFSIAMSGSVETRQEEDPDSAIVERETDALMRCYAVECWPSIETTIFADWRRRVSRLSATDDGRRALLAASAAVPPPYSSPSWVPIVHPLEVVPDLYEAPARDFAVFSEANSDAGDHLQKVALLARCKIVQDARDLFPLTPMFLISFANVTRAKQDTWVPLRGFDFERFKSLCSLYSVDQLGRFWTPRREWLSLEHHSWCCERALNRLQRAAPEGSETNLQRLPAATRIALKLERGRLSSALPVPDEISGSSALIGALPAVLSHFARACQYKRSASFWDDVRNDAEPALGVRRSIAFLIRLAPELFAFYLILWGLVAMSEPK
ncbi:hypothetical protein [Alsobacter sp. R-9]